MSIVLPAVNINGKCKRRKGTVREQFQRDVPNSYTKSTLRPNICHYSFAKEVKLIITEVQLPGSPLELE